MYHEVNFTVLRFSFTVVQYDDFLFPPVRSALGSFCTNTEIINQNCCSWYFALWSNCMQGHRSPSSSPCSSVNIELFAINILWNALRFGISYILNQWQHEWKECENRLFTDFPFLFLHSLRPGIYFYHQFPVNQTRFTSGKSVLHVIL